MISTEHHQHRQENPSGMVPVRHLPRFQCFCPGVIWGTKMVGKVGEVNGPIFKLNRTMPWMRSYQIETGNLKLYFELLVDSYIHGKDFSKSWMNHIYLHSSNKYTLSLSKGENRISIPHPSLGAFRGWVQQHRVFAVLAFLMISALNMTIVLHGHNWITRG